MRGGLVVLIVGLSVTAGACNPDSATDPAPITTLAPAAAAPTEDSIEPDVTATDAGIRPEPFVRACDSAVQGPSLVGDSASVQVGAATFGGWKTASVSQSSPPTGRTWVSKHPIQINGDQRIWLEVAAEDSTTVRLAYDPSAWGSGGSVVFEATPEAVIFEPCPGHSFTQFNGGIAVRNPQECSTLLVYTGPRKEFVGATEFQLGPCSEAQG